MADTNQVDLDIEAEVEKVIQAVANLGDGESYQYDFPKEYQDHIYNIHVQRPYGLAIFYPASTYSRTVLSPKKMRKLLMRVFNEVVQGKTGCESREYEAKRRWARLWQNQIK